MLGYGSVFTRRSVLLLVRHQPGGGVALPGVWCHGSQAVVPRSQAPFRATSPARPFAPSAAPPAGPSGSPGDTDQEQTGPLPPEEGRMTPFDHLLQFLGVAMVVLALCLAISEFRNQRPRR